MAGQSRFRAWWSRHTLSRRCLVAWLLMLPLVALVHPFEGRVWSTVQDIVNALAGSFSGVVVAALFVDRWREELSTKAAREAQDSWLQTHVPFLEAMHRQLLEDLASMASKVYRIPACLVPSRERVPEYLITWDLTARPATSVDFEDFKPVFEELFRMRGPLSYAIQQAREVSYATRSLLEEESRRGLVASLDEVTDDTEWGNLVKAVAEESAQAPKLFDDARTLGFHDSGALVEAADRAADAVGWCAARTYDAVHDLATLELYQPLRDHVQGPRGDSDATQDVPSPFELSSAARRLRASAEELVDLAAGLSDGGNHEPPQSQGTGSDSLTEEEAALLSACSSVLDAVAELRRPLLEQARTVTSVVRGIEADRIAQGDVIALVRAATGKLDKAHHARMTEQWRLFQELNS